MNCILTRVHTRTHNRNRTSTIKALAELTRELMKTDSRSLKRWGREDVVRGAAANGSVAKRLSVGWSLSNGYVDKKKASYKPPTTPVAPSPPVS